MTVANLLLQPQKVRRAAAVSSDEALVGDLIALITRLIADFSQEGGVVPAIGEAFEALAGRLQQQASDGLDRAMERLGAELEGLLGGLADLDLSTDSPAEVVGQLRELLGKLSAAASDLPVDTIRSFVELLVDVVENDLGLGPEFLEQQVLALLDDVIDRIGRLEAESDLELRLNRLALLAALRRLERRLKGLIVVPRLEVEPLVEALVELLERPEVKNPLSAAACYGENLETVFTAGEALLEAVPFTGFGTGSVGAAAAAAASEEEFGWYASWLLGSRDRHGGMIPIQILFGLLMLPAPGDEIWVEKGAGRVVRRNRIKDDEVLFPAEGASAPDGEVDWTKIPVFTREFSGKRYTFDAVGKEAMEETAFHTAWIVDFLDALLHIASMEKGDWVSNLLYTSLQTSNGIYKLATRKPSYLPHWWLSLARFVLYMGGSLEGIHTKASAGPCMGFWGFLLLADAVEQNIYAQLGATLRNALLSTLTLANYEGPKDTPSGEDDRPLNREIVEGVVVALVGLATSQVLVRLIPREDYAISGDKAAKVWAGYWLGGGLATAFLAGTLATVIAQCISWAEDFEVWGWQLLFSSIQVLASYWPSLYTGKENDTDDGKFNATSDSSSNDFAGYPDHSSSPYLLPWAEGGTVYCAQGNQGLWSHHGSQTYAYDFALDQDEEILAARPGTVVDYFDWVMNDTDPDGGQMDAARDEAAASGFLVTGQTRRSRWNFITIRHDLKLEGDALVAAAPDDTHDKDQGGTVTTTFAIYGHGRKESVRNAFQARGVAANNIIGQQIKQGQVIMKSGDTGISAFNHLHMQVEPGPANGKPTTDRSIPFVFKDVEHTFVPHGLMEVAKRDGVPRSLNWYASKNPKVE